MEGYEIDLKSRVSLVTVASLIILTARIPVSHRRAAPTDYVRFATHLSCIGEIFISETRSESNQFENVAASRQKVFIGRPRTCLHTTTTM